MTQTTLTTKICRTCTHYQQDQIRINKHKCKLHNTIVLSYSKACKDYKE